MRALPLAALLLTTAACSAATAQTAAPAPAPLTGRAALYAPRQPEASQGYQRPTSVAVATLWSATRQNLGVVSAYVGPEGILFDVEGEDWPQGWHGVHLHAVGSCEGPGFTSAGPHINHADMKHPHGLLNSEGGPDLGDLQNVYAGADGKARAEVYAPTTDIDFYDADGVAFVVHANRDDHTSQPIGTAGDRIACGVFQRPATGGF